MPSLRTDGATLEYEVRGSGWPLVLLHGAWLDRELWAPQLDGLARECRVVAPDLRGHGASTADGGFDVARLADDLAALCDEVGAAHPVVCGLSLGGAVAQAFATARPDRLAGVVLASTVRSVPPVPLPEAAKRVLFPTRPARAMVRLWGPGPYFRWLLAAVEAAEGPWLALDRDARAYALERIDAHDAGSFLRVLEAMADYRPRDLSGLSAPTLLVHGDREALPVAAQNRVMARAIPDARRVVVPDAAHFVNRDNPAAFGDALASFLDERATAPA